MNYLGIDIGGTNIKAGIVSESGEIIRQISVRTPNDLHGFSDALNALAGELTADEKTIESVGIGCKGIINPATTEVQICPGEYSFLEKHCLADLIRNSLPGKIPVTADNDARAAMIGEKIWGAAKNARDALMLTLGTGVGGAILAAGEIVRGKSGVAGHLGHITIEPFGKSCYCGNRGCLETVFSARAIEAAALDSVLRGCESVLTAKFKEDLKSLTCFDVFDAARKGDLIAEEILEKAIFTLAAAVAGLMHVFDPEILIIGGNIAQAGDFLFQPLAEEIHRRTKRWIPQPPQILKPQIGDTNGIVGAAGLAVYAFNKQLV